MNYSWQVDEASLRRVISELNNFEVKVQKQVARTAFRDWGKDTVKEVRSAMNGWNSRVLQKAITYKIRSLRKNKGIWVGVGTRSGVKYQRFDKSEKDANWAATLSRWYNDGWSPYPKGQKSDRKGKGWRRGLRNQRGAKRYKTEFLTSTGRRMQPKVVQYILRAIQSINPKGVNAGPVKENE